MHDETGFENWLARVDAELLGICGLTHSDLADWTYADAFLDGVTPREAAESVLEENDFPMDLLDA